METSSQGNIQFSLASLQATVAPGNRRLQAGRSSPLLQAHLLQGQPYSLNNLTQRTPFFFFFPSLFQQFQEVWVKRKERFLEALGMWGCASKATFRVTELPTGTHQCTGARLRHNQAGRRSWRSHLHGECTGPGWQEHSYDGHPHRGWEVGWSLKREEGKDVQEPRPANGWALLFAVWSAHQQHGDTWGFIRNAVPRPQPRASELE